MENTDIKFIEEMLEEATAEEVKDTVEISWRELKNQARNFLKSLELLEENYKNEKIFELKTMIQYPGRTMIRGSKEAYYEKVKYLLVFNFDKKLTEFLGDLPKKVLYVYESKGKLQTYEISMQDLARYTQKEGRLDLTFKQLQSLNKNAEGKEREEIINKDHVDKATQAYFGTVNRLNRFYEKAGLEGGKRQGGLLMWWVNGYWQIARVTNKGDIKEAYASFLVTRHQSKLDYLKGIDGGNGPYYSHELIQQFFNKYIYNVTNKPAVVEEDIISQDEQAQYAVKSSGAFLPSIEQYKKVAQNILSISEILSKEQLRNYINETFPQDVHRNHIIAQTQDLTDSTLKELLGEETRATIMTGINIDISKVFS